jgi:transcriptional regulator with XRE-family HTH domain
MGRPTFKIDQVRLRALRQEKGLTQEVLSVKVAQELGTPKTPSTRRHYQRIEEKGYTSAKYAKALATVLGVSVPLLEGREAPDPFEYLQYVQQLLQEQLDIGVNVALRGLLKHHAKHDEEKALWHLAEDIGERIEQVLLVRNPAMIAELIRLTGLAEADLLAPADVRGLWFLSVNSRIIRCTEIVDDVSSINFRIGEIMKEFLDSHGGDSTVRLWRDNPWIRIEIHRPQSRDLMRIDFTRCQPEATGMRWINASWRDDFFLEPGIVSHAYAVADVVTDFSGKTLPGDLHRLRLVVTEHDGYLGKVLRKMAVHGHFDQMPDSVKENFAKEHSSRILFMSWLTTSLRDALMPHLAKYPASRWHLSTNGAAAVDIRLDDLRYPGAGSAELRYRIILAEEVSPRIFERVPVRESDLDQLRKNIETWLSDGCIFVDATDPVPVFEAV